MPFCPYQAKIKTEVTKMDFNLAMSVFAFCFIYIITGVESLFCYKCLNLDCPQSRIDCENVRDFVVRELRSYYYMDNYLPPCPKGNASLDWKLLQLDNVACGEIKHGDATCSLGRLRISSVKGSEMESENAIISHATILGCANRVLLTKIKTSLTEKHECDIRVINGTQDFVSHHISAEHCSQVSDLCHDANYCISPGESLVKTFKQNSRDTRFEYGIVIGIIVVVLVIFGALVLAGMCHSPINRASNLPRNEGIANVISTSTIRPRPRSTIEENDIPSSRMLQPKPIVYYQYAKPPRPASKSTDIY